MTEQTDSYNSMKKRKDQIVKREYDQAIHIGLAMAEEAILDFKNRKPLGTLDELLAEVAALSPRIGSPSSDAWEEAIKIVAGLSIDERFSGHYKNGFSIAQFLAIEALEAAKAASLATTRVADEAAVLTRERDRLREALIDAEEWIRASYQPRLVRPIILEQTAQEMSDKARVALATPEGEARWQP